MLRLMSYERNLISAGPTFYCDGLLYHPRHRSRELTAAADADERHSKRNEDGEEDKTKGDDRESCTPLLPYRLRGLWVSNQKRLY